MDATTPDVKLTYDDLLKMPDDGLRHELIDGEHFVTASPNLRHQRILGELYGLLWSWLTDHPMGPVYFAPIDVVLSPIDVVVPDLVYMSHERAAQISTLQAIRGMPELIVEVLSPSTRKRDETRKRDLYERDGVDEYWIIDPVNDAVRVHRRGLDGTFTAPQTLSLLASSHVLTTDLLPGLEIPLARLFA
jgi:Uma2 family endonuclease